MTTPVRSSPHLLMSTVVFMNLVGVVLTASTCMGISFSEVDARLMIEADAGVASAISFIGIVYAVEELAHAFVQTTTQMNACVVRTQPLAPAESQR